MLLYIRYDKHANPPPKGEPCLIFGEWSGFTTPWGGIRTLGCSGLAPPPVEVMHHPVWRSSAAILCCGMLPPPFRVGGMGGLRADVNRIGVPSSPYMASFVRHMGWHTSPATKPAPSSRRRWEGRGEE